MPTFLLHELPPDHALRNTKLRELKVAARNVHSKQWRSEVPNWHIGRHTYNDLSGGWLSSTEFRVEVPEA